MGKPKTLKILFFNFSDRRSYEVLALASIKKKANIETTTRKPLRTVFWR